MSATEGWMWLHNVRTVHYFVDGRSLCGRYMVLAFEADEYQEMSNKPGGNECKGCWKKAVARLGRGKR